MAIPSRFLKPTARPLKRTAKAAKLLSPTAVGVLLSIGAHALFIAYAPRANFSFAALSEAAQQQDAEETIVPLVELTPAERNRLPGFAQPRRLPPTPTGLGSLALPPGLPGVSRNTPNPGRSNQPSQSIPPASSQPLRQSQQRLSVANRPPIVPPGSNPRLQDSRDEPRSSVPLLLPGPQPGGLSLDLNTDNTTQTDVQPGGTSSQSGGNPSGTADDLGNPAAPSIDEILAGLNGTRPEDVPDIGAVAPPAQGTPDNGDSTEEELATDIPVPSDPIETASAQGDPRRLLESFEYDPTDVDEAAADGNLQEWLVASAENKSGEIDTATTNITIDSQFKACMDVAPTDGLIGVMVNPDGSQENVEVLRSIGYDLLNRQALTAVEYYDFGQPERPTQHQVTVDVIYEPQDCIDALPEVSE